MFKLKKLTAKKILVWSTLSILVVLIIVLTAVPVIFDFDNLNVSQWITNSLISLAIMICAIILGEIIGEDKQKEKVGGMFQNAYTKYIEQLNKLIESQTIIYFSQFYIWFKARELLTKKEGYLVDNGFDQMLARLIIQNIEKEDIESLSKGIFVKNGIKFRKLNEQEIEVLEKIFSPDFKINAPEYTYYLSAFGDSTSVSTLEQAKKLEKKEHSNKTFNRTFKIVLSLFISLIWGMATVSDAKGGASTVAVNMVSRFIALFGGLLSGFLTSVIAVKLASQKLDNKAQVLNFMEVYYIKGEFKPKSYEELVEEELKNEKEQNEDGRKEE